MFVAVGLLITLLSGRYQLRLQQHNDALTTSNQSHGVMARNRQSGSPENTIRSDISDEKYLESTFTLLDEDQPTCSEKTPLLTGSNNVSEAENAHIPCDERCKSGSSKTHDFTPDADIPQHPTAVAKKCKDRSKHEAANIVTDTDTNLWGCAPYGFRIKVFCLFISGYLSNGILITFTYTTSDFVGKAIYGGNPHAPPDSASLAR